MILPFCLPEEFVEKWRRLKPLNFCFHFFAPISETDFLALSKGLKELIMLMMIQFMKICSSQK